MCGIFAYLNYLTPKTRKEILDYLINGLKRLEYRGYDSAGQTIICTKHATNMHQLLCNKPKIIKKSVLIQ
jgi:glucosamine--fructose-6-phosphate aminotransferase (isomerizing)